MGESKDPYYDLIEDFDLIVSSFQTQYGIRLSKDLGSMKWDEFRDLVSSLNDKTPLGHIVSIRSERDGERLKNFSAHERKIRQEWRSKMASKVGEKRRGDVLKALQEAFEEMAGGNKR